MRLEHNYEACEYEPEYIGATTKLRGGVAPPETLKNEQKSQNSLKFTQNFANFTIPPPPDVNVQLRACIGVYDV